MNIRMAGIDHLAAPIAIREKLALTSRASSDLIEGYMGTSGVSGAVILATCNRTEAWLSCEEGALIDPAIAIAEYIGCYPLLPMFSRREGFDAAGHLFRLACGMESMIFGEKQILSQTKKAAAFSRDLNAIDAVLESLFNKAIDSAKKIASNVKLAQANASAAELAIEAIRQHTPLKGAKALVIGNGEMGRLAAELLVEAGASVKMTLRAYKKGESILPFMCEPIPYDERSKYIAQSDAVVSATLSPHFTIKSSDLEGVSWGKTKPFIDLAVPRDIDPLIGGMENAVLYDIDSLAGPEAFKDPEAVKKAEAIIEEGLEEFAAWLRFRSLAPVVNEIAQKAADDVMARAKSRLRKALGEEGEKVGPLIREAAEKAVASLIFGFKDNMGMEYWEACLDSMKKTLSIN